MKPYRGTKMRKQQQNTMHATHARSNSLSGLVGRADLSSSPMRRRAFLSNAGVGFGALALSWLMNGRTNATEVAQIIRKRDDKQISYRGLAGLPHLPPKVKRVIFLCMAGGPSQLETFDFKPELAKHHGE